MSHKRTPLFIDGVDLTLPIDRSEAQEIYDRINDNWERLAVKSWKPKGTGQRYKYRYVIPVDNFFEFYFFTIPIGTDQSSVKITFNPFYLNKKRIGVLRKKLLRVLGRANAVRLYAEAAITRIDLSIDYQNIELSEYKYFCKSIRICDAEKYQSTIYMGTRRSKHHCRIYRKDLEELDKKKIKKSKQPVLRFEWSVKERPCFAKLSGIENQFERMSAYKFDLYNPLHTDSFIRSRADNRDVRAQFIQELHLGYFHNAIRKFDAKQRAVILTGLKPYLIPLFPDDVTWGQELKKALRFLGQLQPEENRKELKRLPSIIKKHRFNIPMASKPAHSGDVHPGI